jgi:hypothetical protein
MVEQAYIDGQKEAVLASPDVIMANSTPNPRLIFGIFFASLSLSLSYVATHSVHSLIDISVTRFFSIREKAGFFFAFVMS